MRGAAQRVRVAVEPEPVRGVGAAEHQQQVAIDPNDRADAVPGDAVTDWPPPAKIARRSVSITRPAGCAGSSGSRRRRAELAHIRADDAMAGRDCGQSAATKDGGESDERRQAFEHLLFDLEVVCRPVARAGPARRAAAPILTGVLRLRIGGGPLRPPGRHRGRFPHGADAPSTSRAHSFAPRICLFHP